MTVPDIEFKRAPRTIPEIEDRIQVVHRAFSDCVSPRTPRARALGRELTRLIRERNDLRTHHEIHQIEQQRGLSA